MERSRDYLSALLLARLPVVKADVLSCRAGYALPATWVRTPRLILATKGEARYTVDGRTFRFAAPDMLLVAPHALRGWIVPPGRTFELAWVEFQAHTRAHPPAPCLRGDPADPALERASIVRIRRLLAHDCPERRLWAEGELKALLARFLSALEPGRKAWAGVRRTRGAGPGRRGVELAADWLGEHCTRPDALSGLHDRAGLSPNHFRLLFRRWMGLSPQRFLLVLRMRAARTLLREGGVSVKEAARATGYADPLYFSRLYRRFWGAAPSEDR